MTIRSISSIPVLRNFACKHVDKPIGEFLQTNKDGSRTMKYIWKCRKCGRVRRG